MKFLILLILSLFIAGCVETSNTKPGSSDVENKGFDVQESKETAKLTGSSSKFNPLIRYDLNVEIDKDEGTSEVEFEKSFRLDIVDKEEIIKESARILRLDESTVRNIIEFDFGGEDEEEDEDDNEDEETEDDTSIEVVINEDGSYSTVEFNKEITISSIDKDQIINEIKTKLNLAEEVIQHSIEFEDDEQEDEDED